MELDKARFIEIVRRALDTVMRDGARFSCVRWDDDAETFADGNVYVRNIDIISGPLGAGRSEEGAAELILHWIGGHLAAHGILCRFTSRKEGGENSFTVTWKMLDQALRHLPFLMVVRSSDQFPEPSIMIRVGKDVPPTWV